MKTLVVYHRADFDGLFSGAVCLHWLKKLGHEVTLKGWDFGDTPIDGNDYVDIDSSIYVVDLPPECVEIEDGEHASFFWIDHHKSSIEKYPESLPGLRIDGVAACRLAWYYFQTGAEGSGLEWAVQKSEFISRLVREPLALTLAGEYDVWDKRDYRAEQFQFGLTACGPWTPEELAEEFLKFSRADGAPTGDLESMRVGKVCNDGEAAMKWQQAYAADVCKSRGYRVFSDGLWFWCLASIHAKNSMWFPQGSVPNDVDALMCYRIEGTGTVTFSLYHKPGREELDLSEIAVKWGGGGHKGACGFEIPLSEAISAGYIPRLLRTGLT